MQKKTGKGRYLKTTLVLAVLAATLFYGFCYATAEKEYINKRGFVPVQQEDQKVGDEALQGEAWQEVVVEADAASDVQVSTVTYAAGSRSDWHVHPGGQVIMVTEGEGYYQDKGSPKRLLRKGDVVRCLPGLIHWHGATPNSSFSYIAIKKQTRHGLVEWMEPVGEEAYQALPGE